MPRFTAPLAVHESEVSVPRRALRGHAPHILEMFRIMFQVSVPRRALRGHAPKMLCAHCEPSQMFQCPEGR